MHNKTRVFVSAYWRSHHFSLSSEHVTQTRCTACASKAALNAWLRSLQCLYWTYNVSSLQKHNDLTTENELLIFFYHHWSAQTYKTRIFGLYC